MDPRALPGTAAYRRAVIALFCAGGAAFGQLYAPQGILPEIATAFDLSADVVSWVVGAATIGVAVGVVPWAMLSDRIGRVNALRLAVVCSIVVSALLPFAPNFGVVVVLRTLEGLAVAGVPAVAVTALAESVRPLALGAAVGAFITGNSIGGLAGRMLAAAIGEEFGWRLGALSVTAMAAIGATVFLIAVQQTKVRPVVTPVWRGIVANLRNPGVLLAVTQGFLLMGSFVSVYNYLTFRLQEPPFNLSLAQVSLIFLSYILGGFAARAVWTLASRSNTTRAMVVSMAAMLIGCALMLSTSLIVVLAGLAIVTIGFFGGHSLASTLGPQRSTHARSMAPPLYNLGAYSGSSVIGWLGGVVFVVFGWGAMVLLIVIAGAVVAGLSLLYAAKNGGSSAVDLA